jgi:hypothetical protein
MVRAILAGKKVVTRRMVKLNESGRVKAKGKQWHLDDPEAVKGCPYGLAGDRLWVMETFASTAQAGEGSPWWVYRATDPDWATMEGWRWKPSLFMPRGASRITLAVKGVRVERLHALTEEEALLEGVVPEMSSGYYNVLCKGGHNYQVVEGFVGGVPQVGEVGTLGAQIEHVQHVPPG